MQLDTFGQRPFDLVFESRTQRVEEALSLGVEEQESLFILLLSETQGLPLPSLFLSNHWETPCFSFLGKDSHNSRSFFLGSHTFIQKLLEQRSNH